MAKEPQPQSQSSQKQPNPIPEMELGDFRKLMRLHFSISCEATAKEYLVRFIGPPYKAEVENCRYLAVMTHNRGTKLSPHNIKQVLAKFEIGEDRFHEAYQQSTNKVAPIRPESPEIKKAS